MEQIIFIDEETNEEVALYVLEETTINQIHYLLVTDGDDEESNGYIFKEVCADDDSFTYEPVEDEVEYQAIIKVFEELLEDTDFMF